MTETIEWVEPKTTTLGKIGREDGEAILIQSYDDFPDLVAITWVEDVRERYVDGDGREEFMCNLSSTSIDRQEWETIKGLIDAAFAA